MREKYIEKQRSAAQIAHETFTSKATVLNRLKHFRIPIRSKQFNAKLRSRIAEYGKRRQHNELLTHKREQTVLAKMKELRSQGYSYRDIAKILSLMKIPTKTKHGTWHPYAVKRILDRTEE